MPRHRKLVVDELLTRPSAVSPTLFVGLGGAGCKMVDRVARHLQRRPDYEERYKQLVKFALIDTNVNDLEQYRENADQTFLISDFEKEQYSNLASGKLFLEADPYFTQWVPPDYRFRAGDTAGAGQIRIESRLGLFYQMKHRDFIPRFRRLLEDLKSHELGHRRLDSAEIRIILCYSVAGGTGSGSHLPLAYLLRDLASDLGKPFLIGVSVLPAVFEEKTGINTDGTFANSYAALKESEHLMKLGAPDSRFFPDEGITLHYNPSDDSKKVVHQRPFEYVYLIDKPESFSVTDLVAAAADGLFLQFFSPLFREQASDYDNYTQHQRFLVPHDFESKGIVGFTTYYGSYGAAVLLVPVEGLVDYCAQAASLSLMRDCFVREIPGERTFQTLRMNREIFNEVTRDDDSDNEAPIHRSDFDSKEQGLRDRLKDRLFLKRVRLLAHAELNEGRSDGRFFALFRHGQRLGERPTADGRYQFVKDYFQVDRKALADGRMSFSINALVLDAIAGERPKAAPGLLAEAAKAVSRYRDDNPRKLRSDSDVGSLKARAPGWADEYRRIGLKILTDGYSKGTTRFPGLENLVNLDFLKKEAGAVDLAAKRYAVGSLREEVEWEVRSPEPPGEYNVGDRKDDDKVKKSDTALLRQLDDQAEERAMYELQRYFAEQLGLFKENLDRFANLQRVLEEGFDQLQEEQNRRLDRLRDEGDQSTNRYILDAEALQIEDGRRMWDFYYEDRIAGLPELSLGNREIQQVLSDTVTDLSVTGGSGATTATLDKLFTSLREHAQRLLKELIGGDPHSPDEQRRDGLTLPEALELEVIYRALYNSNREDVVRRSHKAIRELVADYRNLPPENLEKVTDPKHRDYLRDKVKRVVKEKASLLCVYDESRDQHGGVRPNHVFLAAIDERFRGTPIDEALNGADIANLKWVYKGWHNPKEVIFYRAVLNVPLYVFGRMIKMKHYYYRFRGLAKRPKVLHIDKNWEESLPDLDPDTAKDDHRKKLVRNHIINFAALLTISNTLRPGKAYIQRQDGRFFLADPEQRESGSELDANGAAAPGAHLGDTLGGAIEKLPEVLEQEAVKYRLYQQILKAVRDGLAPRVLRKIASLPFDWRKNRDELRNQYGSSPEPIQQERLKDYEVAFSGLKTSLEDLLKRLRDREIEHRTLGAEIDSYGLAQLGLQTVDEGKPKNAASTTRSAAKKAADDSGEDGKGTIDPARSLEQSIAILRTFSETWRQLEHPEASRDVPPSFLDLFMPLAKTEFDRALQGLKSSFDGPRDDEASESAS